MLSTYSGASVEPVRAFLGIKEGVRPQPLELKMQAGFVHQSLLAALTLDAILYAIDVGKIPPEPKFDVPHAQRQDCENALLHKVDLLRGSHNGTQTFTIAREPRRRRQSVCGALPAIEKFFLEFREW